MTTMDLYWWHGDILAEVRRLEPLGGVEPDLLADNMRYLTGALVSDSLRHINQLVAGGWLRIGPTGKVHPTGKDLRR